MERIAFVDYFWKILHSRDFVTSKLCTFNHTRYKDYPTFSFKQLRVCLFIANLSFTSYINVFITMINVAKAKGNTASSKEL